MMLVLKLCTVTPSRTPSSCKAWSISLKSRAPLLSASIRLQIQISSLVNTRTHEFLGDLSRKGFQFSKECEHSSGDFMRLIVCNQAIGS